MRTLKVTPYSGGWLRRIKQACCLSLLLWQGSAHAQVSPSVPATTKQHNKQVIGYITQWDAWKDVAGLVPKGGYNHLNVDYSQYTILNFSFFGVAKDGSLHSGDFRNKNIYQVGAVQEPAPLVNEDIYSSWDMFLLYGELDAPLYYISDNSYAYSLDYRNEGSGWKNVNTGATGAFPLSVPKQGGAPGVIDLAHQKGVKVMASIGGWSMCKHYPEVAGDATKRAKFVADCQKLMSMGFDGIDFDWEYPNDPGMNIEHYSQADYTNFAILVEAVRAAIGPNKLISAAFSAVPSKLQGFPWSRLNNSMNYFNMMTYDYNGGWSNKAGHNAPLYDYPGAEYSGFSLDATVKGLRQLGANMSKVNLGAPFYGRGVITSGPAALNGATTKRAETVQPDGPIQTCADYTNWAKDLWDGTPPYSYILQATGAGSGWTEYWDDVAKVPYKTKGNYFLSYDNERSIGEKAQYIVNNGLAGVIVWQVFGDMTDMTSSTVAKGKLIYCPNTKSKLVNKLNEVFANGSTGNQSPAVSISSPANNASFTAPASVTITATASDNDGSIAKVEFYNGAAKLGEKTAAPYTYTWSNIAAGTYTLTAKATDDKGAVTTSAAVTITATTGGGNQGTGKVIVGYWHNWNDANAPYIRLRDVNAKYNVIDVAFAEAGADQATLMFTPDGVSAADFKSDVALLQSQGRKVLLSIGGQNGIVILATATQKAAFVSSLKSLMDQYNFDGFDIDLEGGTTLILDNGDKDFTHPTTAKVVNLVAACKEVINYRKGQGKDCWLTMAPETYYVQTAYGSAYSPLVGAYLPVIYGLKDELTFIHPQLYNTGSVTGLDNKVYNPATSDFIVSMTEMLLAGFPVSGTSQTFPALREDQVAFGLPASTSAAGSGYTTPANVKKALDYLTKGQSYGGAYTLRKGAGYPGLRGIMTWSVNWDKVNGDEFATNYYDYFFGNNNPGNNAPTVSITSPANNATFTPPATVSIQASANDSDGSVAKVEFFNGSTRLGESTAAPYSYSWTNVAAGTYTLTAKATDNKGAVTTSTAVTIVVGTNGGGGCNGIAAWTATDVYTANMQVVYNSKVYKAKWWTQNERPDINNGDGKVWQYVSDCTGGGGNTAPAISLTSPASNASFAAPANITIQATATDSDGNVAKVEFFNGGSKLGESTTAPYSYTWANVAAGTYTLTAKATDNAGAATTSAAVTVVVTSGGGTGNCAGVPTYEPYPKIYNKGDRVVYNGMLYESLSDALYNVTPGTADWWWKPLGACGASLARTAASTNVQTVTQPTGNANLLVYPNPLTGNELQVRVDAQPGDRLQISLLDMKGNAPVLTTEQTAAGKGTQFIKLQTGQVPAGIWILKVENRSTHRVATAKVIRLQ
ncbi:MAG TPA: glycosyl hydrolase family 18 protein [Chitinophaga sp.]|uniref:glycosyl hydrolase family 18 protein n=1 Tax=Chitinophaga sp. TaxID=1869181 RepID=UPI002DB59432|nr:glycosyl hydrolase family 18 protein [Chitinophaga sp.]HEU4551687.1 glycosyl hydrolase family 18 protein [Chitinophaga sp.]